MHQFTDEQFRKFSSLSRRDKAAVIKLINLVGRTSVINDF